MGIILKARKVLKKKVLLQLYHSFVTPYLIYCLEIWGNASDIHLQPLNTTQKNVRIITFSSYCSHTNRDFRLVGVHVWNYICDNINIDTPFASFKRILKKLLYLKNVCFI